MVWYHHGGPVAAFKPSWRPGLKPATGPQSTHVTDVSRTQSPSLLAHTERSTTAESLSRPYSGRPSSTRPHRAGSASKLCGLEAQPRPALSTLGTPGPVRGGCGIVARQSAPRATTLHCGSPRFCKRLEAIARSAAWRARGYEARDALQTCPERAARARFDPAKLAPSGEEAVVSEPMSRFVRLITVLPNRATQTRP